MEVLPAKHLILAACRGEVRDDHPVLRWASDLSDLHQQLPRTRDYARDEIDCWRLELIREINSWVARQLPFAGGARLHTETLGAVVDRLAMSTACARTALQSPIELESMEAWERLAELAVGYEDLKEEVITGRRRFPSTW